MNKRAKEEIKADDIEVVTEEDSIATDNDMPSVQGEIEPTEDGDRAPQIEEAKNVEPEPVEEEKKEAEPIVEDLTTPKAIMHIDDVPDWAERITRANYNDEQKRAV